MKYEYKVETYHLGYENSRNDAELTKILNQYGSYGWELIVVDHEPNNPFYKVFLKRAIMDGKTL